MLCLSKRWTSRTGPSPRSLHRRVGPQGQRQAGLVGPPLAEVDQQRKPLPGVGELALVDDQSRVDGDVSIVAGGHGVEDLVERHDEMSKRLAQAQPQGQKGGGQRAGDGDRLAGQPFQRPGPAGHEHRPVTLADAGPAGAEHVEPAEMGVGVDADGGQFQLAGQGPAVERLDVLQLVREAVLARGILPWARA